MKNPKLVEWQLNKPSDYSWPLPEIDAEDKTSLSKSWLTVVPLSTFCADLSTLKKPSETFESLIDPR